MGLFDGFDDWAWDTSKLVRDLFGGRNDEELNPAVAGPAVVAFRPAAKGAYDTIKQVSRIAGGIGRDATALIDYAAGSTFENLVRPGDARNRYSGRGDFVKTFGRQFYIAQLAQDLARGKGVNSGGEGFFPGGNAYAEAEAAVQENRPKIGSHAFTLGRASAYPGVKLGIYSEDSIAYKIISGFVDTVKVVTNPVDPFNWTPGVKPAGIAAGSRAAQSGMRITAKEGFVQRFASLQDEVLKFVDSTGNLSKANLSPEDAAKVDEYLRVTQLASKTIDLDVPAGAPSAGAVFKGRDADDLYDSWKRLADTDFNDFSQRAGLVNGDQVGVVSNRYLEWRNSAEGYDTVIGIRDAVRRGELEADDMWKKYFNREGYRTADLLVTTMKDPNSTIDDYWRILDEATLFSLKGGERINASRMLSGGMRETILDIPVRIKTSTQDQNFRLFEMMPENLNVKFEDVDGSLRNVDAITTVLKLPKTEKTEFMNRLGKALTEENSEDLLNWVSDFNDRMVYQAFINNGFTPQEARGFASAFNKSMGEDAAYIFNDIEEGVPLQWLDGNGIGPFRRTQVLSHSVQLMDFSTFDRLIEFQSLFGKFKGVIKDIKIGGKTVKIGNKAVTAEEFLRDVLLGYSSQFWKPSRVASGRHFIRVIPEETLRALASGIFDSPNEFFATVLGRTLRDDALGRDLTQKALTQQRLANKKHDLDNLIDELRDFEIDLANGKYVDPEDQAKIAQIPELVAKRDALEERIANSSAALMDAMLGGRRRAGFAVATGEPISIENQLYTRGVLQFPQKTKNPTGWKMGFAHEFGDMLANVEYRKLAAGRLLDTDKLTIAGQTKTIVEHIADGAVHPYTGRLLDNDIDAIKLWLFDGDGRQGFEEYWTNLANKKPQYENRGWDNYQTASEWIDVAKNDITSTTGDEPRLLEILATGKHNGKTVIRRRPDGRYEAKEGFDEVIEDFMNKPYSPQKMRNFIPRQPNYDPKLNPFGAKLGNAWNSLMDAYFTGLYGNASDFVARNPVPRAAYWRKMEELIIALSPDEATKLLDSAKSARLSRTRLARVETAAAAARGEGTVKEANLIAEHFAVQFTRDLLYDSSKRSLFGKSHPLMFSFFESQREVTQTWLKLISQNPAIYRNIAQFQETALEEGWIYENEQGRKVFEVPMSAAVMRAITGGEVSPIKNYTIGTDAVNIALQMRPGFGFVAQYLFDNLVPNAFGMKEFIQEVVSPFGSPEFGSSSVSQILWPEWVRQLVGGVTETAPDLPGDVISGASKFVFGDVKDTKQYGQYLNRALQHIFNNYPDLYKGQDGLNKAMDDAQDMANKWIAFRGFTAGFGPGAPMTEWLATTKYGQVEVGILLDDLNKLEREAVDAGQPSYNGFNQWIEKWGESVWVYAASLSQAGLAGQSASKEFEEWANDNSELLDKYPFTAGYLGPRGEFDLDVYSRQARSEKWIPRPPDEVIASAQNKMGNYLYYKFVNQFDEAFKRTPAYRVEAAEWSRQIKTDYPGWDRPGAQGRERSERLTEQLIELRRMAGDESVAFEYRQPLNDYFVALDQALKAEEKRGVTVDNWGNSKGGLGIREYIRNEVIPTLLANYPKFAPVWEQVLSYELQIDEP